MSITKDQILFSFSEYKHFGLRSGLWFNNWPQQISVCHSVFSNRKKTFFKNICEIKYSFRTYHFSHKYLHHLPNHCTLLMQAIAIHSNLLSCHSEKSIHNPPQQPDRSFTMVCYLGFSFHGQIKFQQKSLHQKNLCTKKYLHQKISAPKISTPKNLFTKNNLRTKKIQAPNLLHTNMDWQPLAC